jgi:hypothetical protein
VFSAALLRYEIDGYRVEPAYLDDRYTSLARALLLHYQAFDGKPYRELERALVDLASAQHHETRVIRGLRRVIEESMDLSVASPIEPKCLREAVFGARAKGPELDAEAVYRLAAAELGLLEEPLQDYLYADLRPERLVRFSREPLPAPEILSRYNLRLLQGLFFYAERVEVEAGGSARAIYRFAKLNGLMVEAKRRPDALAADGARGLCIEISGPLSLFQRTRRYGLALARFLPACALGERFRIKARLALHGKRFQLEATGADRVLSTHRPPRLFDSKLEERFYKDFVRLGSPWSIAREEQWIQVGSTVFFPDFSFRRESRPGLRVDLEILGFWTRDYLARKLSILSRLGTSKMILCVDRKLACDRGLGPFPCIEFAGRVPAEKVLEQLERLSR